MAIAIAHDLVYLLGQFLGGEARVALLFCGVASILLLRRIVPRVVAAQLAS